MEAALLEVLRAAERATQALMPDDPWAKCMEILATELSADMLELDMEEA